MLNEQGFSMLNKIPSGRSCYGMPWYGLLSQNYAWKHKDEIQTHIISNVKSIFTLNVARHANDSTKITSQEESILPLSLIV